MSTISWETAIKEGTQELERRDSEIFLQDGETKILVLAKNEQGNFKNLKVITRGDNKYKMYGVPCVEGSDEKFFYIFPADAKTFFDIATNTGGRVLVARSGKKNTYTE